jgi:hypothetical protein
MMGPKRLNTIRDELREVFGKSDREIVAWFDEQLKEFQREPKPTGTQVETFLALRNALLRRPKKKHSRRQRRRAGSSS